MKFNPESIKRMKKGFLHFLGIFFIINMISCSTNDENQILPPAEDRVSAAVSELNSELLVPGNGWRINYKPTPTSGTYLVLMKFTEDGNVRIQSDLSSNDGEFYDGTVPYRIDVKLSTELILETYGFFHFLFEQDQSTFGAEFEFSYKEKVGDNLVFESKTDLGAKTVLTFEPAGPNDAQLFSRELSENLEKYLGFSPRIFGQLPAFQQLYLNDKNISIFWELDPIKRNISFSLIGEGNSIEEIITTDNFFEIFHDTGYTLADGKLILDVPVSFNITGEEIVIDVISLNQFSYNGDPICSISSEGTPLYLGQISGVGPVTLSTSLISTRGFDFKEDNVYTVNAFFVFDSLGNSLLEDGVIGENYPGAGGFAFLYGADLANDSIPKYSTGIIDSIGDLNVRTFSQTITYGNKVNVNLQNAFYFSGAFTPENEQKITAVTDDIFYGGVIYAYNLPASGLIVYRLYNPCNKYEFALLP
jgi:hypothetical protein